MDDTLGRRRAERRVGRDESVGPVYGRLRRSFTRRSQRALRTRLSQRSRRLSVRRLLHCEPVTNPDTALRFSGSHSRSVHPSARQLSPQPDRSGSIRQFGQPRPRTRRCLVTVYSTGWPSAVLPWSLLFVVVRERALRARPEADVRNRRRRARRAAGRAARRDRHGPERLDRPDARDRDRSERPLRGLGAAARGQVHAQSRDSRVRQRDPLEPRVQRRPARRLQLHAEAVERAGDGHRRRRVADGADDLGRGDVDDRSHRVREPAGQGAQLLPSPHARLQRRGGGDRLERGQRRRRRGLELRHLRRRHEQPLEVADAAARAAARLERLRARDGQGSAAHHQPVLRRVRRALGGRGQHDHQERHQRA